MCFCGRERADRFCREQSVVRVYRDWFGVVVREGIVKPRFDGALGRRICSGVDTDALFPQAQVSKDALDHLALVDEGHNAHLTAAYRAQERVSFPHLLDEFAPFGRGDAVRFVLGDVDELHGCPSPGPASSHLIPATPRTSSPASATPSPSSGATRPRPAVKAKPRENLDALRVYFRDPNKFFKDHLSRYSKSRRKAPIYGPLSTESGTYTLWIYYHRLTADTLYACITNFVAPKQEQAEKTLARLAAGHGRAVLVEERRPGLDHPVVGLRSTAQE